MIAVKRKIQFKCEGRGRKRIRQASESTAEQGRVPRVSRLMALAIRFDMLIRQGIIGDQSELARLAHVTQPRMTQIMNLLRLAPDIQEELLFLPRCRVGRDKLSEKQMRPIAAEMCWAKQRQMWQRVGALISNGRHRLRR
jgi:hypothetical protein